MKSKPERTIKKNQFLREQILKSMIASFRIEGIEISSEKAAKILEKVEVSLERSTQ